MVGWNDPHQTPQISSHDSHLVTALSIMVQNEEKIKHIVGSILNETEATV
jgi:hypothetical protein